MERLKDFWVEYRQKWVTVHGSNVKIHTASKVQPIDFWDVLGNETNSYYIIYSLFRAVC